MASDSPYMAREQSGKLAILASESGFRGRADDIILTLQNPPPRYRNTTPHGQDTVDSCQLNQRAYNLHHRISSEFKSKVYLYFETSSNKHTCYNMNKYKYH
ncbi:unnamed protein product [Owenia fusiformis]|uniref:Uncharacterized protein n=1 Tax=Owenia fusiformis TaxID=6347 RepID=A0A8J1Y0S4_OWEFU|nr:unnamed protein product [Owenia fusiformis]